MAQVEIEKLTYREYEKLPETGPRYQLIDGELHLSPAPDRYHQVISRNLQYIIMRYLEDHPFGELYNAPFDVHLSEHDVFQPDLCFISEARADILVKKGMLGSPDWAAEILSPSTASLDKRDKRLRYAKFGVKELWLIDPELCRIHVYDLSANPNKPTITYDEGETFSCLHFPGLNFESDKIFFDKRRGR